MKIVLLSLLLLAAAYIPQNALAYYINSETVAENSFKAGSLNLELTAVENSWEGSVDSNSPTDSNITVQNAGGMDFTYSLETTDLAGNTDLCGTLLFTVEDSNNQEVYADSIENFSLNNSGTDPDYELPGGDSSTFNFAGSISPEDVSQFLNETCEFNLTGKAWMAGREFGKGFWDEEQYHIQLTVTENGQELELLNLSTEETQESTNSELL